MAQENTSQVGIKDQLGMWKAQTEENARTLKELKLKAENLDVKTKQQFLEHIKKLESKIDSVKNQIAEGERRVEKQGNADKTS